MLTRFTLTARVREPDSRRLPSVAVGVRDRLPGRARVARWTPWKALSLLSTTVACALLVGCATTSQSEEGIPGAARPTNSISSSSPASVTKSPHSPVPSTTTSKGQGPSVFPQAASLCSIIDLTSLAGIGLHPTLESDATSVLHESMGLRFPSSGAVCTNAGVSGEPLFAAGVTRAKASDLSSFSAQLKAMSTPAGPHREMKFDGGKGEATYSDKAETAYADILSGNRFITVSISTPEELQISPEQLMQAAATQTQRIERSSFGK